MYIPILFVLLTGFFLILKIQKKINHQSHIHKQNVLEYNNAIGFQKQKKSNFNKSSTVNSEDLINFKLSIITSQVQLLTSISNQY
jgi:hypothetical protein